MQQTRKIMANHVRAVALVVIVISLHCTAHHTNIETRGTQNKLVNNNNNNIDEKIEANRCDYIVCQENAI